MSGSQTHGFDLVYEISLPKFRDALASAFLPSLAIRMTHVDVAFPVTGIPAVGTLTQTGALALAPVTATNATLTRTDGTTFALAVTFPHALLSLDPITLPAGGILGGGGSFLGVHGADVGPVVLTLHLSIASGAPGIVISRAAASTVAPLAVSNVFNGATVPPGVAGGFIGTLQGAVGAAGVAAIASAAEGLLPIPIPITLPDATRGPCGIGPAALTPRLVPAAAGTVDALAFLVTAAGSTGAPDLPSVTSHLPAGIDADLLLGNELALRIVCCVLPRSPQLTGFPSTPSSMTPTSCTFTQSSPAPFSLGSQRFDSMSSLTISIGSGSINVSGTGFRVSGTGWEAIATFSFSLGLHNSGGSLVPAGIGAPVVNVDSHIEWWVWLLIAIGAVIGVIVGALTGGTGAIVIGGIIGAVVGLAIVAPIAMVVGGFGTLLSGTIGGALGAAAGALGTVPMIPADLFAFFGTPAIAGDATIDDVLVPLSVQTPSRIAATAQSFDQTLTVGTWVDLDTGTTGTGTPPPGADLVWRAQFLIWSGLQTMLSALDPARLQLIGAANAHPFDAIGEPEIAGLVYPAGATVLAGATIGRGATFGVRTSAGRYAKCLAWAVDSTVHLRYVTYDTPLPLRLPSPQIRTTRGRLVAAHGAGWMMFTTYEVARDIVWTAQIAPPLNGAGAITYMWRWNDAALAGNGTLPDGTVYAVSGPRCEMRTAMGKPLGGTLCVIATTRGGFGVEACTTVGFAGTDTSSTTRGLLNEDVRQKAVFAPPGPGPDPVEHVGIDPAVGVAAVTLSHAAAHGQLQKALAAGLKQ